MRSYVAKDTKIIKKQIEVYKYHIDDFYVLSETRLLGLQIENIYKDNSGIVIKKDADKLLAKELIVKTKELLALDKQDFQLKSILSNNLFILNLMVGKFEDFESISKSLITIYNENISKKTVATELYDFLIIIVNLIATQLYNENTETFYTCLNILKKELQNIKKKDIQRKLELQIFTIELQFKLIHNITISENEMNDLVFKISKIDKKLPYYLSSLNFISLLLYGHNQIDKILILTSKIIQEPSTIHQQRHYYQLKISRALAWLKKENLKLFDYEINSVYKFYKKINAPDINIQIVNFIKFLEKKPNKINIAKKLEILEVKLEKIKTEKPVSEYMSARMMFAFVCYEV